MNKTAFLHSKSLWLILFFFSISGLSMAQTQTTRPASDFWQNVRFGGGVGLSFANEYFSGTLAPQAIYQFNPHVGLGLGLNATYARQKDFYTSTILGASLIGLFSPIPAVQISSEFEELHLNRTVEFNGDNIKTSYWYPALFFGVGYNTGNITFGLKYDVLYDADKSVYANAYLPFIRVFF